MRLRLATFNLEDLGIRVGTDVKMAEQRLPRHMAVLREVIGDLQADAIAFQELIDPSLITPLLAGLDYPYCVVGNAGSSPLKVGVFSRYPLFDESSVATNTAFRFTDPKTGLQLGVEGEFSRPVLRVTWAPPAFATTLFVVHAKSKIPSRGPAAGEQDRDLWKSLSEIAGGRLVTEMKRLAQMVELRRTVDHLLEADPHARIAVLGDFNDTLESEAVRCLLGDAKAVASPHLESKELHACELEVKVERRYTQLYRGQKQMIDHILISPALRRHLVGVEIRNQDLRDTGTELLGSESHVGSDHAPLLGIFETEI